MFLEKKITCIKNYNVFLKNAHHAFKKLTIVYIKKLFNMFLENVQRVLKFVV